MSSKCAKCEKTVYALEAVNALNKTFHKTCFRCKHCDNVISFKSFSAIEGEPYCKPHYLALFKSRGTYSGITGAASTSSGYNASAGLKGILLQKTEVINNVAKPAQPLKKAETLDKSQPVIEQDVVIKKVDRTPFIEEVQSEHDLKPATTLDKSIPVIEQDVVIKKVDRKIFLNQIETGPEQSLEKPTAVTDRSSAATVFKASTPAKDPCAKCGKTVYPMENLMLVTRLTITHVSNANIATANYLSKALPQLTANLTVSHTISLSSNPRAIMLESLDPTKANHLALAFLSKESKHHRINAMFII